MLKCPYSISYKESTFYYGNSKMCFHGECDIYQTLWQEKYITLFHGMR